MSEQYVNPKPKAKKKFDYSLVGLFSVLVLILVYVVGFYWAMIAAVVNLWEDHTTNAVFVLLFIVVSLLYGMFKVGAEVTKKR